MSVWKSDEKLLIFAFLTSPSKSSIQMKHLTVHQKYTPASIFSPLFSVFHLVMKHCISCLIYYIKKSSDWPNRSVICYISFIFHHPVFKLKYSRLPITWTFQGNWKKFESAGVWVIRSTKQITRKEEMGWGMNASNMQNLINTQCWTLLYLNWTNKKVKTKNKWLLK